MISGNSSKSGFRGLAGTAAVLLFAALTSPAADPAAAPAENPDERVLVIVEGEKLTEKMARDQMAMRIPANPSMRPAQREMMYRRSMPHITAEFIGHVLLKKAAKQEGITVDDEQVEKALQGYRDNTPEGRTFEEMIAERGLTMEEVKVKIRENLSIPLLLKAKLGDDFAASEEEIAKHYEANKGTFVEAETVHARHILLKFGKDDDDATKAAKKEKAVGLREKLLVGADFAELAREHSDCPSKTNGGDLGTFKRGRMVTPFEDAAFSQEVGKIGEVVESKYGYHIIQILAHNQASEKSFAEVKRQIAEDLAKKKFGEATRDYLETLKKTARIEYPMLDETSPQPAAPEAAAAADAEEGKQASP